MAQQTGAIYHQGILYSGGSGTNVTPNPQGEATDTLNTVEIDGTVYDIESSGGSDVTITPTLNTGQKLADYSIDGTLGAIYMPTVASGNLVLNPSETPTDELTKIGVSSSIEDAYLANGKIATSAGYYITCPLDKTLINGTYTIRVRDGASTYNFEVTYSGSTITKSWSAGSNNYTLTITSTTAGMSYYSGDYRNIYCDIVMMIPQMDVYSVSSGGGGSNLILDAAIFSMTEKQVGLWIDNKPLYQCTEHVVLSTPIEPSTETSVTLSSFSNAERVFNISVLGGYKGSNSVVSTFVAFMEQSYIHTASDKVITNWNKTLMKVQTGSNYANFPSAGVDNRFREFYVTIQYTKTTDTAGSGGYQAYGFTPVIYTEEEREIGVWLDNKPLYQKTVDCGYLPNNSTISIDHNISNLDMYCHSKIFVVNDVGSSTELCYTAGANDDMGYYLTPTKINIVTKSDRTTWRAYATIQYTKTTDVAGSGEYNTLAIPNVHYSTDEQVIGTWVDGRTLYQKTWHLTAPSTTSSVDLIPFDGSNTIIRFEGYIKISNNCTQVGGNSFLLWQRTATNNIACQVTNSAYNNGDMYVTAVYYKTT